MDSLAPGTLLARRYRLLDRIGVGGMSVIWRANDEMLHRGVAVKVLASDLAADDRFRELVRTEARAAAALSHPHITATYDYGETVNTDGQVTTYVVMELLQGESLAARLTAGALPWPEALRICVEVAEALAAAHRHGIVHRDVTADNVMLTSTGAKILDFGIATTVGAPDEDGDGMTFGTPAYVAPERLDGRKARPATDTYALGVLLFEALTGHPPFPAETWEELVRTERDQPPALAVPGLPRPVATLCHQCLCTDPQRRPSASQVAWTLRRHLPGAGRRLRPGAGTQRALTAAGAAAALLVGVVVGATVLSPRSPVGAPPAAEQPVPDGATGKLSPGYGAPYAASPAPATADPPVGPDSSPAAGAGQQTAVPGPSAPEPGRGEAGEAITLSTIGELVDEGRATDDIRDDVALDLRQQVDNLEQQVSAGDTELSDAATQLRDAVRTRAAEGSVGVDSAQALDSALDQLAGSPPS